MSIFDRVKSVFGSEEKEIPFGDVRDDFEFTGFTDTQEQAILGQLEQAWGTESGQEMLQAGLDGNGLHYLNVNSQAVIEAVAPTMACDNSGTPCTVQQVPGVGNFALPNKGEVYLNGYDAIDSATGKVEVYTNAGLKGQTAAADHAIQSLDHDGVGFSVPPVYTLIHETNHAAVNESDINGNTQSSGEYYSPSLAGGTRESAIDAYEGKNEDSTQEILSEMGYTQFRGSYLATNQGEVHYTPTSPNVVNSAPSWSAGDDLGLGQKHDVAVTMMQDIQVDATGKPVLDAAGNWVVIDGDINMTKHASVSAVVVDTNGAGSIRTGNLSDTAHGMGGDDNMNLGGGNDRGYGGLGDDSFTAARGMDYYDGGEANLDPASNHQSDNTTNWGIDSIDYRALDIGGGAAGMLSVEHSFDGTARDGIKLIIEGRDGTVLKGSELGSSQEQADYYHNIDIIHGTNRDDLAEVKSLDGLMYIDGSSGNDTLNISNFPQGTVTHVPGAGTFNGQAFEGYVQVGSAHLFYNDYENIILPPVNAPKLTPEVSAPLPVKSAPLPDKSTSLTIPEAARALQADIPIVETTLLAKQAAGTLSAQESAVLDVVHSPAPGALLETLQAGGVEGIDVADRDMGTPYARVHATLSAGYESLKQHELSAPDLEPYYAQQAAAQQAQQAQQSYAQDESLSAA